MIIIYPVNTSFPSTRANTIQILNTANALAEAENEVHLICRKIDVSEKEIFEYYGIRPSRNLQIHPVTATKWLNSSRAHESLVLKQTLQILNRYRREKKVLFTRDPLFARLAIPVRKGFHVKIVYEAHTLFSETARETYMPVAWSEQKEKRIRKREQFVFTKADAIVFISSSLRDFVQLRFPIHQPSTVIHDGTNVPDAISLKAKKPEILCYSGQFYWWKGMAVLMEAMRWVEQGMLHLYGGGYSTVKDDLELMQNVIEKYHLEERIRFRGFLPPAEIPQSLSECSLGILPLPKNIIANHCNSPLKLFDYMANGLTVVSSDLLTVREIIEPGRNGHLVNPDDPRALADGINRVLADRAYRESLARNAFETVREYSWQLRGAHLTRFLNQL